MNRQVPTVGQNRAEMDALLQSSESLRARVARAKVSEETILAMLERERIAPSSELVGRPKR